MKLAHITPCFAPATAYGGPIASVTGLCRALASRGHDVRVLTTDADGESILASVAKGVDVWPEPSLRVRYARRWARESISPELLGLLASYVRWADVVHVEAVYSFPTIPTLALCRRLRKPLVWSPRGALEHWSGTRRKFAKQAFETVCRIVRPRELVLHATSSKEAEKSRQRLPRVPVAVIPNGVELGEENQTVGRERCLRLVYLGRLDQKKGVDNLLEACTRLHDGLAKPWHLTIAGFGKPAYEAHLRHVVKERRLADRVSLVGAVHGDAKERLFQQADVVVVPSYMENFCIVVAEALAHGVPVIASQGTPWEGLEDRKCGLWVDNAPAALSEAISRISALPLSEMGRRGRQWVAEEFLWPTVAEQMEKLYGKMLDSELSTDMAA